MPSGKTHDAITFILAIPTFVVAFLITGDLWQAGIVGAGFLFGGMMFGPDLDTASKQYSRWGFLKILWYPYRNFFKHRSRWSHGLIFGTFLRVVYFMGVATCTAFLIAYLYTGFSGRGIPDVWDFARAWAQLRVFSIQVLGVFGPVGLFIGMWTGAASHTFADLAGSYVKTGRVSEFL